MTLAGSGGGGAMARPDGVEVAGGPLGNPVGHFVPGGVELNMGARMGAGLDRETDLTGEEGKAEEAALGVGLGRGE